MAIYSIAWCESNDCSACKNIPMPPFKLPLKLANAKRKSKKTMHFDKMPSIRNAEYNSWTAIMKCYYEGKSFLVNTEKISAHALFIFMKVSYNN